jgi:tetratricopeptide (TPR) repeat protein
VPLPGTIRALVERRLGGLERDARALVSAAAVVGREANPALLERVGGLGGAALLEALDELLRRQILEESAGGRLRFTHDKLREGAYDALAPDERARLHGAAARAIEAGLGGGTPERAARLGEHWKRAGDAERARPYFLAAAGDAAARHAHAEAERLYRAFLGLAGGPSAERVEALVELGGSLLRLQGRFDEGADLCRAALDEARGLERRDLEATAVKALGMLLRESGRPEEAEAAFDACVAAARASGNRIAEAAAIDGLGSIAYQRRRLAAAQRLYREASRVLAEAGDRCQAAVSVANVGIVLNERGMFGEAADMIGRALEIHRAEGKRVNEGIDLTNLGVARHRLGRLDEAIATFEAALAVHRETGYRHFEGLTLLNLADSFLVLGRVEDAEAACRQSIRVLEASGDKYFLPTAVSNYGIIGRVLGDYERAERCARRALELGARHRGPDEVLLYECDLAFADLARGRPGRGRLAEIERAASRLDAPAGGELASMIAGLRRAVEALERGEPLLHGEHPRDARPWVRARAGLPPVPEDPDA